jgi:parvulin-like peptidyl-prolyl isomerase
MTPAYKGTASMTNAMRLAVASLLLVPAALVLAGCSGSDSVPTDAIAVVDGTDVPRADLDALMARAKLSYKANKQDFPKAGTTDYQSLQTTAVAYLVQLIQYEQQAEELGITVTEADIDERVAQVLKQPPFNGDQKQLDAELAKQGYTQAAFRTELRTLALRDKLAEALTKNAKVSEADIAAYYEQNKATYTVPESRDVRHILLTERKADGSVDYAKSKALADDVYQQIQDGGDFAALAKKYSQDPGSKDNGGKYTARRGETVAPFEQTAFNLDVGVTSRPVKTEYGYHLIQPLGEITPGSVKPLAKVHDEIQSQLLEEKKQELLTEWAAQLRKDYDGKVQYAAGFEPPDTDTADTTTTAQD